MANGQQPKTDQDKGSQRERAWRLFLTRVLSLEPGIYEITLAISNDDGVLLGGIDKKAAKVERWG